MQVAGTVVVSKYGHIHIGISSKIYSYVMGCHLEELLVMMIVNYISAAQLTCY